MKAESIGVGTVEAKRRPREWDRSIHRFIYVSAAIFILILQLTGWMEPSIRTLHMGQSAIYVVIIVLCAKRKLAGYGAGIGIATFWNAGNLFVTNFIKSGWTVLVHLMRTGNDSHAEMIVAPLAAAAHFVLIGACIAAYLTKPAKQWTDGLILVGSAFAAIFAFFWLVHTWGPQYLYIFWTMLNWLGIGTKG
jgi:hypothetical protein